jgi:hypothetical protein
MAGAQRSPRNVLWVAKDKSVAWIDVARVRENMVEVDENRSLPHVVAFSVLIASSLRAILVSATLRRCAACFSMNQFPAPGNL